jgi:predicted component of type VI protein secretion system
VTAVNPLKKFESFIRAIFETPFARIFPSPVQPAQVRRRLELEMEDNLILQGEGRILAPNLYIINVSSKDYQSLSQSFSIHVTDWQDRLVEIALQRHYTLKTRPIMRLEEDSELPLGKIRIQATLADKQHLNAAAAGTLPGTGINNGGLMETRAISPEQLAQIRAQAAGAAGAQNSGPFSMGSSFPGQPGAPLQSYDSGPNYPGTSSLPSSPLQSMPPVPPVYPPQPINMPSAVLSIRLPQAGEQVYRIEKPVIKIGRQLNNDIIVEDKRVSRYHAQIKFQLDGQFAIFDLGSTNGITINGIPHQRHHILRNGDCFTIGSYDFYFQRM